MVVMCQSCDAGLESQNGGQWGCSLGNHLLAVGRRLEMSTPVVGYTSPLRVVTSSARASRELHPHGAVDNTRTTSSHRGVHPSGCKGAKHSVTTGARHAGIRPVMRPVSKHDVGTPLSQQVRDVKKHSAFSAKSDGGGWTLRRHWSKWVKEAFF